MRKLVLFTLLTILLASFVVSQVLEARGNERTEKFDNVVYDDRCLKYTLEQTCLTASGGTQTVDRTVGRTVYCTSNDTRRAITSYTFSDVEVFSGCETQSSR